MGGGLVFMDFYRPHPKGGGKVMFSVCLYREVPQPWSRWGGYLPHCTYTVAKVGTPPPEQVRTGGGVPQGIYS